MYCVNFYAYLSLTASETFLFQNTYLEGFMLLNSSFSKKYSVV